MKFAKSMLLGTSALGLAIGSAFADDSSLDMSSAQAATEEILIVQPAVIVAESTPAVVDSSGAAVLDASGRAVASSGAITSYDEAVVLYELTADQSPMMAD